MTTNDKETRRAKLNALKEAGKNRPLTSVEQRELLELKKAELVEKKAKITTLLKQLSKPRDDQALTEKQKVLVGVAFAASCRAKDGTDWRRSGIAWRSMVEVLHQHLTRASDRAAFPELRNRPAPLKSGKVGETQP